MLIRFLDSLHVFTNSGVALLLVYAISVPVIYLSIRGVHNFFVRMFKINTTAVYQVTGLVLTLHALIISLFPTLYLFTPSSALFATAWLLWFGGVVLLLQSVSKIK
jgi:hypothetical protein